MRAAFLAQHGLAFMGGPLAHQFLRNQRERGGTIRVGRVGPQGGADDRPTRRQRPPRPPDVQRGDVPMPNRLLPPRVRRDALDGQVNFDEAFGVIHARAKG